VEHPLPWSWIAPAEPPAPFSAAPAPALPDALDPLEPLLDPLAAPLDVLEPPPVPVALDVPLLLAAALPLLVVESTRQVPR
jgi:hypothetical protein